MAFPGIPTIANGRLLVAVQATTTAVRNSPNLSSLTKNSGDLLIVLIFGYQSSLAANIWSGWTAGWTEFIDVGAANLGTIGGVYKWSTGSETGAITGTQGGTVTGHAVSIAMSIPAAHATTPPAAGGFTQATGADADPGSLDPAGWAAEDTLWIAAALCGETS